MNLTSSAERRNGYKMNEKNLKIILGVAGILMGVFFIKINGQLLFEIMAFILGALTVLTSLLGLIKALSEDGKIRGIHIILNGCGIALGVLLMFYSGPALLIGIGIYMIAFPIFDIIMSPYRSEQLKAEFPKILVGIGLIVIGPGKIIDIIIKILGILLIILSAYFIFATIKKEKH